jgi:hypothetical protein
VLVCRVAGLHARPDLHLTCIRLLAPEDDAQPHRLPCAVVADDADPFALAYQRVDPGEWF